MKKNKNKLCNFFAFFPPKFRHFCRKHNNTYPFFIELQETSILKHIGLHNRLKRALLLSYGYSFAVITRLYFYSFFDFLSLLRLLHVNLMFSVLFVNRPIKQKRMVFPVNSRPRIAPSDGRYM